MLCFNISNITIITVKNLDCRCIIHSISKSEAINSLKKYVPVYHGYILKKRFFEIKFPSLQDNSYYNFCLVYIKWLQNGPLYRTSINL